MAPDAPGMSTRMPLSPSLRGSPRRRLAPASMFEMASFTLSTYPKTIFVVLVPRAGELHGRGVLDVDLRRQRHGQTVGHERDVGDAEHAPEL